MKKATTAKKTILRKSPANENSQNTKKGENMKTAETAENLFDVYQSQMEKARQMKTGIVTTGKYNLGKTCIDINMENEKDILQDAMLKLLETAEKEKIEKPEHLLNKARKQCRIDCYKRNTKGAQIDETGQVRRFIEFDSNIADIAENSLIDQNEKRLKLETLRYIGKNLKANLHKRLFAWYFVKGETVRQMEAKTGIPKSEINRQLIKIQNRIHRLKVSEIYNHSYASPGYTAGQKALYPPAKPPKNESLLKWTKSPVNPLTYKPAEKKIIRYIKPENYRVTAPKQAPAKILETEKLTCWAEILDKMLYDEILKSEKAFIAFTKLYMAVNAMPLNFIHACIQSVKKQLTS